MVEHKLDKEKNKDKDKRDKEIKKKKAKTSTVSVRPAKKEKKLKLIKKIAEVKKEPPSVQKEVKKPKKIIPPKKKKVVSVAEKPVDLISKGTIQEKQIVTEIKVTEGELRPRKEEIKPKEIKPVEVKPKVEPKPKLEEKPVTIEKPIEEKKKVIVKEKIKVTEFITVGELADKLKIKSSELIKRLIQQGVMASINQRLDLDTVALISDEYGYEVEIVPLYGEEIIAREVETEDPTKLKSRSPVVTIMGHVDHGKTSLLDAIRETNVAGGEAGGITQHIGAYKVKIANGEVVFLDTPGHEAFTAMRARGAQITDIVVLVVAADDGVMPQTVEAINHAKAANVPILVAINKIDLPNANINRIKQELSQYSLASEDWGGKTIYVEVSAKKKIGLAKLLEMLLLEAEMLELKADPTSKAKGTVVESRLDRGRGAVATVLVQKGTLKAGDVFVAGLIYGKVRAMLNDRGQRVKEVGPSTPVEVLGLSGLPQAGDLVQVVSDEKEARHISFMRQTIKKQEDLARSKPRVSLEELYQQIKEGTIKELKLIIKADVQGSAEALRESLEKLSISEIKLVVIHSGVGGINESDVILASVSNAIIIGFNVRPEAGVETLVEKEKVDMRLYRIIYEIIDDIKKALEGMLEPEEKEVPLGRAEIRQIFKLPKGEVIAGCYVNSGLITRNAKIRLVRDNIVVYEGRISSLRRFKEDVKEVASNYECGVGLENFNDLKTGDNIEAYKIEKVMRKLEPGM